MPAPNVIQWNHVSTVTNGPKSLAVLASDRIYEDFNVLGCNVWPFCRAKKSVRNNEVTVLPRLP